MTFNVTALNEGFRLIPVLIGMFAIGKILGDLTGSNGKVEQAKGEDGAWSAVENVEDAGSEPSALLGLGHVDRRFTRALTCKRWFVGGVHDG